ncbi:MAG: Chaperone protein DnaK [Myxococcota bacterium]|nr:Chaperone protein DnaK [Myxococcota bacterium]
MFFRTPQPPPVGTEVKFSCFLASGAPVFEGTGAVVEVKTADPSNPKSVSGCVVRFVNLDQANTEILNRVLYYKTQAGARPSQAAMPAMAPQPSVPAVPAPAPAAQPVARPKASADYVSSGSLSADGGEELPELTSPTGPVIGIDLGTTNSCAAVVENGKPIVIPSRRGYNTIPSMVAINDRGKLLVGHVAKSQFLLNPKNTVYGAKRLIGRKYNSPIVQSLKNYFTYEILEAHDGSVAVKIGAQVMSLPKVSSLILSEIKEIAQEYYGQEINRCVITVPAYYNDNQRNAVRLAGRVAAFHVERIVNEPTAAALAYGFGRSLDQRVLIYDLGGGTFDASVLHIANDVYEVVSTGGNNFLGGIDFDIRIVDYFNMVFRSQHGIDLPSDTIVQQRVKFAAEAAKISLSEQPQVEVHVPFIHMHEGKPLDLKLTLTRDKLHELTEDLVDKTLAVCDAVLAAKNIKKTELDEIILVGGQSRYPLVWRKIEEHFQKKPNHSVHPDEVVALGAGLLAHSITRSSAGVLLIDVLPISIGLALPGGGYARIIPANTPLPCERKFTISTAHDNQQELKLVILQGEAEQFAANDYMGTLKFNGLTAAPKGQNKIQISFAINNEGILTVTARDGISGREMKAILNMKEVPDEVKKGGAQAAAQAAQQVPPSPAPAPAMPGQPPPQAFPPGMIPPMGMPQGMPQQPPMQAGGFPGQPPPGYPPQGFPPQGYPQQPGFPPGYPPQGMHPGYPPQGYPPGMPPVQGMPPGMPPQYGQPPGYPPGQAAPRSSGDFLAANSPISMGEDNVGQNVPRRDHTIAGVSLNDWLVSEKKQQAWNSVPLTAGPSDSIQVDSSLGSRPPSNGASAPLAVEPAKQGFFAKLMAMLFGWLPGKKKKNDFDVDGV